MSYFPPYIDASGIHIPTYEDRLQDLCSAYRSIFGQEAELTPAVPDYQLMSVFAKALDDTSAFVLSAYNSRNPAVASSQALDLLLPMYGITRQPGESDASVRSRLKLAMAGRGAFSMEAMEAAIRQIPNVTHVKIRVNDTSGTVDSIPPHTIAAMVNNGNAGLIAEAIWKKKPPGIGTSGSVSRTVTDEQGNTHTVKFSRPTLLSVFYSIGLRSYDGFDSAAVGAAFRSTLFQYTNQTLDIGEAITVPQLYGMLYQAVGDYASTFAITSLEISGSFGSSTEKVTPAWNQKFNLNNSETDVTITVSNQ